MYVPRRYRSGHGQKRSRDGIDHFPQRGAMPQASPDRAYGMVPAPKIKLAVHAIFLGQVDNTVVR